MPGPARTAFPASPGNPITSPGKAITFVYPDSGAPAPSATDTLTVLGFSLSEVGGSSSCKVRLHDGVDATGPELAPLVQLAANGYQQVLSFPNGVEVTSGKVFVEITGSGSLEICVFW